MTERTIILYRAPSISRTITRAVALLRARLWAGVAITAAALSSLATSRKDRARLDARRRRTRL